MAEIPVETQAAQMELALRSGIVRFDERRQGAMTWTYYVVGPQFRQALERVLYERLGAQR